MTAKILKQGIQLLARLADVVVDQGHRYTFVYAIPAHRQLRALQQGFAADDNVTANDARLWVVSW